MALAWEKNLQQVLIISFNYFTAQISQYTTNIGMKATTKPFSFIGKLQWNIDLCLLMLVRFTPDMASVLFYMQV